NARRSRAPFPHAAGRAHQSGRARSHFRNRRWRSATHAGWLSVPSLVAGRTAATRLNPVAQAKYLARALEFSGNSVSYQSRKYSRRMIKVRNLEKSFGAKKAVNGVSFTVEKGE